MWATIGIGLWAKVSSVPLYQLDAGLQKYLFLPLILCSLPVPHESDTWLKRHVYNSYVGNKSPVVGGSKLIGWLSNFLDSMINWYWTSGNNVTLSPKTEQIVCIKLEKCLRPMLQRVSWKCRGEALFHFLILLFLVLVENLPSTIQVYPEEHFLVPYFPHVDK